VIYEDFVTAGRRLATDLRKQGAECIIALTHMREPNDLRLLDEAPEIDLILGGHDHHYATKEHPSGRMYVKSGTDFRDLSRMSVRVSSKGKVKVDTIDHLECTSKVPEDPEVAAIVSKHASSFSDSLTEVVAETLTELDGRFASIRTSETNLGNLITDVMRSAMDAEVAVLNSGTLRSDDRHGPGALTLRDMISILPMADEMLVLGLTGEDLLATLENSVSMYPRLEGRFLQVSGISFEFDPNGPPMGRITPGSMLVGTEPLDLQREYRVVTKAYIAKGKDGFDVLPRGKVLVDEEAAPVLPTIIRNFFLELQALNAPTPTPSRPGSAIRRAAEKAAVLDGPSAGAGAGAVGKIAPRVEGRIRMKEA